MKIKVIISSSLVIVLTLFFSAWVFAGQTLTAAKVGVAPKIDGRDVDKSWQSAQAVTTYDPIAKIDIILKSVYTDKAIFFLITFPDTNESRSHRSWAWNNNKKIYEQGKDREDVFVFKWAMSHKTNDLTLSGDKSYDADIWFWKANRTDPAGFADDKLQSFSDVFSKDRKEIITKSGKKMYLQRKGDAGKSSYKTKIYVEHQKDSMLRYENRVPKGSRANVTAKGIWQDGRWVIEMTRVLNTNNIDDINFQDIGNAYKFGVSRYEIAGREPERESDEPLYGSGEITELLSLKFIK